MIDSPEVGEHTRGENDEDDSVPGDARQQHQHERRVELFGDTREPDAVRANKENNQKYMRRDGKGRRERYKKRQLKTQNTNKNKNGIKRVGCQVGDTRERTQRCTRKQGKRTQI